MFNSHTDQQKKAFSETLHSFGLKTTKELLNKTIFLLNFGSLKSHQAVFDEAFGEITEAKRSRSWQVITDCLNEHTNAAMTVMTVRTMYKRAKKKSLEPRREKQHMQARRERSQPQETVI